ncbi:MAG: DUF1343 domain-containing protein [Bacillati bacterium ANGP1]|uniref:DUF1343 domain-containing protein n=1 Tax=Candidatus Segetimicrobium genomatis TaxID=2569760 RepID=A0A537K5L2_9BACT|nr:MAG: DUF1343 domain-containing protein [Terrabacteria group bacterium ANGP1]
MRQPLRAIAAALGIAFLIAGSASSQGTPPAPTESTTNGFVRTGLEVFLRNPPAAVLGKRVGLLTNPTGVDHTLYSTIDLLAARKDMHLVALFGPEHGVRGDGGGTLADAIDPKTHLPIFSLYGSTRSPTPGMLRGIDAIVMDLQDVGARFYTYISTLALAMQAAAEKGIPFIVLDRPNPIGGQLVDGPVLDPRWKSFMGMYPIPILHGMTIGELARMFNQEHGLGANLIVVPMQGWKRSTWFDDTGLPWVTTSPGIPHFNTVVLYPAMGPIGDTSLSVGILTTKPFEVVGATYIQPWRLKDALDARNIGGVAFRETYWRGEPWTDSGGPEYGGVEIRVTDRAVYRPVDLTLQIIDVVRRTYPGRFGWGKTRFGNYLFDLDMGTDQVRKMLMAGKSPEEIEKTWQFDLERFKVVRAKYLLYE